jgi:hypothetical protein
VGDLTQGRDILPRDLVNSASVRVAHCLAGVSELDMPF